PSLRIPHSSFLSCHPPSAPTIPPPSLHDALPIFAHAARRQAASHPIKAWLLVARDRDGLANGGEIPLAGRNRWPDHHGPVRPITDRKSTRLNSSHQIISYAVFCLKKKTTVKIYPQ